MYEMPPHEGVSISFDDFKNLVSQKQLKKIDPPFTTKLKMQLLFERTLNILSCSETKHTKIFNILKNNYNYIVSHKKSQDDRYKIRISAYKNFPNLQSLDEAMAIYDDCIAGQVLKPRYSNYATWGKDNYDKILAYNHILYGIIKK